MPLDEINLRIISALGRDARMPLAQLAKTLGLSTASVHQRYKRLVDQGYITGSRIEVDWERLGL
ncbi:MAG: AsnC family transcriptional regulator, partial [Acidimicrobiia bacterium]|nr:AsnC family transcriptional regulator [Acidimicrobiia bacterium]